MRYVNATNHLSFSLNNAEEYNLDAEKNKF